MSIPLKDIYDIFKFRLRIETAKRGSEKELPMTPREIVYLLTMTQQDIQKRLNVIQSYTQISLIANTNSYTLPSTFGAFKVAMINNYPVQYESFDKIKRLAYKTGLPTMCNVYFDKAGEKKILLYPTPDAVSTLNVYYYVDPNVFKASLLNFAPAVEWLGQ